MKTIKPKPGWIIFVDQIKNFIILLLAIAAGLSFVFTKWLEGISIVAAIIINAVIGFFTELKAVRSIEALRQMSRITARVLRLGKVQAIVSDELVPGDLVLFEAGDLVPADLRLIEASKLNANESSLTGESVPVSKNVEMIDRGTTLAERSNMLFKGTAITRGSGKGVVTATGMDTELGRITALAERAEEEDTPLEKRLSRLGHRLIWITLGIALMITMIGMITGHDLFLIIETAIALAVAAIPEGLPIVATIALARGMWRMAAYNAMINRLSAVETLGATNIILTDKTGTLTENRMTVTKCALSGNEMRIQEVTYDRQDEGESRFYLNGENFSFEENPLLKEAVEIGVLCNNASLDHERPQNSEKAVGDRMEIALLSLGAEHNISRQELLKKWPEQREEAFDPDSKMMATFHKQNGHYRVAVKGAPEAVIHACKDIKINESKTKALDEQEKELWLDHNELLASEGLRVLALATKTTDDLKSEPYQDLQFLGLLALMDPPREDVHEAIRACHEAGIRVVMVTGDQPVTAKNIGLSLGLIKDEGTSILAGEEIKKADQLSPRERQRLLKALIFARVTPKQKFDLVTLHQKEGDIVAMTGDGVNDAPALKKSNIGVAMGRRGTQVAREAADMVLKDDAFKTIIPAITQGRAIFDNIRKFIIFLLSGNVGEIMIVTFPMLLGWTLPILPLQILYLNMIGDVFPALALGVGKGDTSLLHRPPRDPRENILTNRHWRSILGYGLLLALPVLGAFGLSLAYFNMEKERAVTISFLTLAFARLWHVFNMRDKGTGLIKNEVTRNPFVWGALLLCTGLLLAAAYLPGLSLVLQMVSPGFRDWVIILGASLIPLIIGQTVIKLDKITNKDDQQ